MAKYKKKKLTFKEIGKGLKSNSREKWFVALCLTIAIPPVFVVLLIIYLTTTRKKIKTLSNAENTVIFESEINHILIRFHYISLLNTSEKNGRYSHVTIMPPNGIKYWVAIVGDKHHCFPTNEYDLDESLKPLVTSRAEIVGTPRELELSDLLPYVQKDDYEKIRTKQFYIAEMPLNAKDYETTANEPPNDTDYYLLFNRLSEKARYRIECNTYYYHRNATVGKKYYVFIPKEIVKGPVSLYFVAPTDFCELSPELSELITTDPEIIGTPDSSNRLS